MSADLPVGVVGVGHLGRHHARIWSELPGARLVGVVDTDGARAEELAAAHGARVFPDPEALAKEVRAVSVAVPTVHHAEVGCVFLERGLSVLVEKPIAPDLEQADRLIEAAGRNGALLMVGHTERFNPAVRALESRLSRPLFIETHRLGSFSPRSIDIDVVQDLMIHDLDVILSIVEGEVVSVDATGVEAMTDKVDIANVRLHFSGGAVANVTASRISVDRIRKLRIFQPRAYLSLDYAEQSLESFVLEAGEGGKPAIAREQVAVEKQEPLRIELETFRRAVVEGGPLTVPGEQGRRALELALRIGRRIEETRPSLS
jgi:predicted dehydrogenase